MDSCFADEAAPGQQNVDSQIASTKAELENLESHLVELEQLRGNTRAPLRLLFDRGQSLETIVRDVLGRLGALVEEPREKNKEDGWITVTLACGKTFNGVLEIKSTRNEQFDQGGLRQLSEWAHCGIELRNTRYKPIFIGLAALEKARDKRSGDRYPDNWKKTAELQGVVALDAEIPFDIFVLDSEGKLNRERFWAELFGTDGVFDPVTIVSSS